MLSDNAIDSLVQALVERQVNWNTSIMEDIAKRVYEISLVDPFDFAAVNELLFTLSDERGLNASITKLLKLQTVGIKELLLYVLLDSYNDMKPLFDYRGIEFLQLEAHDNIMSLLHDETNNLVKEYNSLVQTSAFMLRDPSNPKILVPTTLSQTYKQVIDEAVRAVSLKNIPFETVMRGTIMQLVNSGIRSVSYNTKNGGIYTQRLDSAVRRSILSGVHNVVQEAQKILGEEIGADGIELSAHINPAEDHEEVQGHQFTNEQFDLMQNGYDCKDIEGNTYAGFDRPIGWWNCRHIAYSIIIGQKKQRYSNEKLNDIIQSNHKGYTLPNGKHLTMYDCTQEQRKMETEVRTMKDGQVMARALNDRQLAEYYQAKINACMNRYNTFSEACGLPIYLRKMQVSGYRKISVK